MIEHCVWETLTLIVISYERNKYVCIAIVWCKTGISNRLKRGHAEERYRSQTPGNYPAACVLSSLLLTATDRPVLGVDGATSIKRASRIRSRTEDRKLGVI